MRSHLSTLNPSHWLNYKIACLVLGSKHVEDFYKEITNPKKQCVQISKQALLEFILNIHICQNKYTFPPTMVGYVCVQKYFQNT